MYFITNSALYSKAAVRKYMYCRIGDDFFSVLNTFLQFAIRESVTSFLNGDGRNESIESLEFIELEELAEENFIEEVTESSESNASAGFTITACAFRASLNRSHTRMQLFKTTQSSLNINTSIIADVKTQFDSTVSMFECITRNKSVLLKMKELGYRSKNVWPTEFNFSSSEFNLMSSIVKVLQPVRDVTKFLFSKKFCVGDVVPLFPSFVDEIRHISVPENANVLKQELIDCIIVRIQMLLGIEETLPISSGEKLSYATLNEFVVFSYLLPRYGVDMHNCYGFTAQSLAAEMDRIHKEKVNSTEDDEPEVTQQPTNTMQISGVQSWISRMSSQEREIRVVLKSIRNEFDEYFSDIAGEVYSDKQNMEFWIGAAKSGNYCKPSNLARLQFCTPGSAIPQQRVSSELNCCSSGLRIKAKIETLDWDKVVYG